MDEHIDLTYEEIVERYKYVNNEKGFKGLIAFCAMLVLCGIICFFMNKISVAAFLVVIGILGTWGGITLDKNATKRINCIKSGNFKIYIDKIIKYPGEGFDSNFKTEIYTKHVNEVYNFDKDKYRWQIEEGVNAYFLLLPNKDRAILLGTDKKYNIPAETYSNITNELPDNLRIRSSEFSY